MEAKVRKYREKFGAHPIIRDTLDLLAAKLPPTLFYHAFPHTEDVLSEAILFGVVDNLSEREIELLAIAAVCHDMGFIQSFTGNEPIAAAYARAQMEKVGSYTADEISLVEQMILDTTLIQTSDGFKQVPSTKLSRYLLDADLSNLGRDDFFEKGALLRKELDLDIEPFRRSAYTLIGNHQWHTDAARSLRESKKQENIAKLKAMIG